MTPEIYQLIKERLSIIPKETLDKERAEYLCINEESIVYRFDNAHLNAGVGCESFIKSIVHPMSTANIWNVAQRFYSFLKWNEDFDDRLRKSAGIYRSYKEIIDKRP